MASSDELPRARPSLGTTRMVFSDGVFSQQFVEGWGDGDGENSFLADPPNTVLSTLAGTDETPQDVVVTLTMPRLEGDTLTYSADVLEGELPKATGPCSLFIDPIGRPLSPVSVCRVRRRQRRRAGRL
jgi:hypothetical protein